MTQHRDMLIVGAGILGLSHAYAAAKRGLKVTVFERSETPLGASLRSKTVTFRPRLAAA